MPKLTPQQRVARAIRQEIDFHDMPEVFNSLDEQLGANLLQIVEMYAEVRPGMITSKQDAIIYGIRAAAAVEPLVVLFTKRAALLYQMFEMLQALWPDTDVKEALHGQTEFE